MEEEIIINAEVKGAKESSKELDTLAKNTNKADEAAEKYNETLLDTAKDAEVFGVSLNSLQEGFKGSVKAVKGAVTSLKGFKIALAATGVGAIVIALGGLITAFSQTQKGMDLVEDVTTTLTAAWRELSNLTNEITGILGDLFGGTISVAEAWDQAGEAVNTYVEETKEAIAVTKDINAVQRELDAEQRKYILTLAQQNFELAEQKRIGEDTQQAIEDRVAATERARDIIAEQGRQAVEFAERQLELEKQRLEGLTLTDEEETRLFELEAEIFRARGEAQERDIEFQNKYNGLLKEAQTLRQQEVIEIEAQKNVTTGLTEVEAKQMSAKLVGVEEISNAQTEQTEKAVAGSFQELIADANKGIVKAFASLPFPLNLILGGAATALFAKLIGSARSAISSVSGGVFEDGGMIHGRSHAQGGVILEAEGGEAIINKRSMANPRLRAMASAINVAGGGIPFFQSGGIVPDTSRNPIFELNKSIGQNQIVLVKEDLDTVNQRVEVSEAITTLT